MADSMTQSMASVSSLARDFSWEQLHTDTEREVIILMVVVMKRMVMKMMINTMMVVMVNSIARDFS